MLWRMRLAFNKVIYFKKPVIVSVSRELEVVCLYPCLSVHRHVWISSIISSHSSANVWPAEEMESSLDTALCESSSSIQGPRCCLGTMLFNHFILFIFPVFVKFLVAISGLNTATLVTLKIYTYVLTVSFQRGLFWREVYLPDFSSLPKSASQFPIFGSTNTAISSLTSPATSSKIGCLSERVEEIVSLEDSFTPQNSKIIFSKEGFVGISVKV